VLNLPTELAVRLPGQKQPVALGSLYRRGGVALTADAVRELTGLQPPRPDRYVVMPRAALRQLINGIGGLEIDPPRTMRYEDKAQKLKIDLQGGLQRLGGAQVEQLVRYRDRWLGEADRRNNQQRFESALRDRLRQSEPLTALPGVLRQLEGQVQTNLTPLEALSLLAAGLDDRRPIAFASLPLDPPKPAHGKLRQLSSKAPNPLWPEKQG
jgi:LCP family protein required for cell wall assembly